MKNFIYTLVALTSLLTSNVSLAESCKSGKAVFECKAVAVGQLPISELAVCADNRKDGLIYITNLIKENGNPNSVSSDSHPWNTFIKDNVYNSTFNRGKAFESDVCWLKITPTTAGKAEAFFDCSVAKIPNTYEMQDLNSKHFSCDVNGFETIEPQLTHLK